MWRRALLRSSACVFWRQKVRALPSAQTLGCLPQRLGSAFPFRAGRPCALGGGRLLSTEASPPPTEASAQEGRELAAVVSGRALAFSGRDSLSGPDVRRPFLRSGCDAGHSGEAAVLPSEEELQKKLLDLVRNTRVVLFMKGSPDRPLCGFSARAVRLLEEGGVEEFTFVDCASLQIPEAQRAVGDAEPPEASSSRVSQEVNFFLEKKRRLREAVRVAFDWPTLPLLVVEGEVVGGADILQSLHDTGELRKMLAKAKQEPATKGPPSSEV